MSEKKREYYIRMLEETLESDLIKITHEAYFTEGAIKDLLELLKGELERLTDDDFETIRIHLNAQKEKLCNQKRWKEAEEYQRIIDRFMAFAFAQPDSQPTCNNLQQLATTCNQLATDTISRQVAIDAVNKIAPVNTEYDCRLLDILDVRYVLTELPSVESERKKGKWIKIPEFCGDDVSGFVDNHFSCSECKKEAEINSWGFYVLSDFCPNCGADMRGE